MEMYHIYNASLEINEAAFIQPAHLQWLFPPLIWKIRKCEYLWSIVASQAFNTFAFLFYWTQQRKTKITGILPLR